MGSSLGIREVAGEYVWTEVAQDAYPQDRRELLNNKDWEAGVEFLEREMRSSWWEWLVRSRCFF